MSCSELPCHVRNRICDLLHAAKVLARAGHAGIAGAYQGAAEALFRGDETTAEVWLEKADAQRYAAAR